MPTSRTARSAPPSSSGRGAGAPRRQRVLDRAGGARGRGRARAADLDRRRRRPRLRGLPGEHRRAARRDRGCATVPGDRETLDRMRALLDAAALWEPDAARFLQDPLTFRCVPQVHGAARDALTFVEEQLAIELNAHQGNPLVVPAERAARLGRELRLAAARRGARLPAHRARARADGGGRADAEAAEPAVQRPQRGLVATEGTWQDGLSSSASRPRRSPPRRGCSPSPSRSSWPRRCRSRASRTAPPSRRSERDASRRCSTSVRESSRSSSWSRRRPSTCEDEPTLGAGAAAVRAFVRERVPYLDLARADAAPARGPRHGDPLHDHHRRDDVRRPPAPLARGLRRSASRPQRPPFLDGVALTTQEGTFEVDLGDHVLGTASRGARPRRDRRCRPLAADEPRARGAAGRRADCARGGLGRGRAELRRGKWRPARAFSPSTVRDGFVGVSLGSSRAHGLRPRRVGARRGRGGGHRRVRASGRRACDRTPTRPPWWDWVTGYPARMQEAYLAWLAFGRERWPSLRVVFAMLAGGGVRSSSSGSHGAAWTSARPSTRTRSSTSRRTDAGRSSSASETFGVSQLVYGSDTPVVDSRPTLDAVRGFGDAVTHVLQSDTPTRLLT